jgi:cell volume regulation protein A
MHSENLLLAQHWLLAFLILFVAGTVMSKAAEWLRLPDVALYLLAGIALGPQVLGLLDLPADSTANQLILVFGACFILFHGGTITSFGILKHVWLTITLLSTLGVAVTAFVTAGAVAALFGVPLLTALLLGAILASTDPAALVPIFQKFPVRPKVAQTVITESAFTDATGAIMTTVIFGIVASSGGTAVTCWSIASQFALLAFGGIAVGAAIGYAAAFLISENDRGLLKEYTPMVTVLTVLGAYSLAEVVHASGFMAVFAAGLVVGNAGKLGLTVLPRQEHAAHDFLETVSLKLRMIIFIALGSQVDFAVLREYGLLSVAAVAVFIIVARPLTVLVSLLPDRKAAWKRNEVMFFFWTRETGVIAAALVGIVSAAKVPGSDLMQAVTFVAILATLLLQAGTTPWVAKALGLLVNPMRQREPEDA